MTGSGSVEGERRRPDGLLDKLHGALVRAVLRAAPLDLVRAQRRARDPEEH